MSSKTINTGFAFILAPIGVMLGVLLVELAILNYYLPDYPSTAHSIFYHIHVFIDRLFDKWDIYLIALLIGTPVSALLIRIFSPKFLNLCISGLTISTLVNLIRLLKFEDELTLYNIGVTILFSVLPGVLYAVIFWFFYFVVMRKPPKYQYYLNIFIMMSTIAIYFTFGLPTSYGSTGKNIYLTVFFIHFLLFWSGAYFSSGPFKYLIFKIDKN